MEKTFAAKTFAVLAVLLLLPPFPSAWAEQMAARGKAETLTLRYSGHFGGFHIAQMGLVLADAPQAYHSELVVESRGMLRWFEEFEAKITSAGVLESLNDGPVRPAPLFFERSHSNPRKSGRTEILFDPQTGVALGKEDGEPDEHTPEEMRTNVMDPLAALVALRAALAEGEAGERHALDIYDGKRRYRIDATLHAPQERALRIGGRERERRTVIPVSARLEPVSGFDRRRAENWRAASMRLYFSADEHRLPLQVVVETRYGAAVMNLQGECDTLQHCMAEDG